MKKEQAISINQTKLRHQKNITLNQHERTMNEQRRPAMAEATTRVTFLIFLFRPAFTAAAIYQKTVKAKLYT